MSDSTPAPLDASSPAPAAQPRRREYVVVARRYRPQTFEELVGQEHVGRALSNAIRADRVGHAYLFTGARGVGKTSAARIFAKALNCVTGPTPEPCNRCDICQSISSGDDVDVLEIDGASNRGIEEMRELRQNVNVRPSRSRFKIYIIDEVHMLTREAFNALLKTLEEPPEHVKFVFCTTEPEKIPITILSRCQRFDFAGIQPRSIVERLRQIVAAEGVEAEPEALESLARRAAGSMRDSQSLLEQLLAFCGPKITVGDVHRMLGSAADHRLGRLVGSLIERDAAGALGELDAALAEGVDVGQLLTQLFGYLRDVMVACVGSPPEGFLHTSPSEHGNVQRAGNELGLDTVLAILQILDQTLARLRYSTQGRTLAELALVRITRLADLQSLADLIAELRDGVPSTAPGTRPAAAPMRTAPPRQETAPATSPARSPAPQVPGTPAAKKKPAVDDPPNESREHASDAAPAVELTTESAEQIWRQALAELPEMLRNWASFSSSVAISAPNRLVVTFPAQYTSCKSFCERPERLAKLEEAVRQVSGRKIRLDFVLGEDQPDQQQLQPAARRPSNPRELLLEKSQHPLVRRAAELFDARPYRIDEPKS